MLFDSAIEIPEWKVFACGIDAATPDVRIEVDRSCLDPRSEAAVIDARECTFVVRDVACFSIRDGDRILVAMSEGVDEAQVRVFLLGSALAAICAQRNLLLLHASVVRIADRVIALCGPPGSGKSTLAAGLIDRGAQFVCDDLTRFDAVDGVSHVYPSTPRLKIAPDALAALHWPAIDFERVYAGARKFHVPQIHADPWSPLPLHGIYVLSWTVGPVEVIPLTGLSSLREVVEAATYRHGLLEPMGQLAAHWQRCAAVIAGLPVKRLSRSQTWSALTEAVAVVEHG